MITLNQAKKLQIGDILYHSIQRNADGSPLRAKVNGKVKTWERNPNEVKIPIKHGLYNYGYYIHNSELSELWCLTENKALGLRKKWWVGQIRQYPRYEMFSAFSKSEAELYAKRNAYAFIIGPHKTKRGAEFMASSAARNNPHCQTSNDADRIAKQIANEKAIDKLWDENNIHNGFHPPGYDPISCLACKNHI